MNILLYHDRGTAVNAVKQTYHCLKTLMGHAYDIIYVDAKVLKTQPWEDQCAMLVVPGGRDLPYCEDLGGLANNRIRRYVEQGGSYLGICAGGYYASSTIEFEKGDPVMQICGSRELSFYPGVSRGTIYPGFVYNSESGARSVDVLLSPSLLLLPGSRSVKVYYNGGGYFAHADMFADDGVQVLARYDQPGICDDEEHPAAIIQCSVGRGHAVLMGIHPEYSVSIHDLTSSSASAAPHKLEYKAIVDDLLLSQHDRHALLRAIFTRIGLRTRSGTPHDISPSHPQREQHLFLSMSPLAEETLWPALKQKWMAAVHPEQGILPSKEVNFSLALLPDILIPNDLADITGGKRVVSIHRSSACIPSIPVPSFDTQAYFAALESQRQAHLDDPRAQQFGDVLLYTDLIHSTQSLLDRNYAFSSTLPDGLVCLATHQSSGRGRGRNSWISQQGALQFSVVFKTTLPGPTIVFLQYLIALAVVDSVRTRPGYEGVPLFVKWPNDIYANHRGQLIKVGGCLLSTTMAPERNQFLVTMGCGLNVNNRDPTVSLNQVIGAQDPSLPLLTLEDTLAGILAMFTSLYSTFCSQGMGDWFLTRYYRRWLHSHQLVTLSQYDHVQVLIQGISKVHGFLMALDVKTGIHYELQPDGNTFDMMKGLITIKK
ncbi:class II aaRS and biotin synthetase [Hesseltinella vesiculosa]|uniref:Class II aaRS and biotin synthetase n=1 Tax=Hesseltinella vesiculosa TaxID=101127 RepID=A0A1X2GFD8_9FUNG|nr:class II aaRS and biotin synthetase [Hesseltinella vesiculosa]